MVVRRRRHEVRVVLSEEIEEAELNERIRGPVEESVIVPVPTAIITVILGNGVGED